MGKDETEKREELTVRVIEFAPDIAPVEKLIPLAPGDNVADAVMADLIPRLWPDVIVTHPPPLESYVVKARIKNIRNGKIRIPHPDELA